jgi:hypothetical protein
MIFLFKIMIIRMFATLDKAKPHIESIRGLNLAVVACTTVQVSRMPWWLWPQPVGHNLLYGVWTDMGLCIYCTYYSCETCKM